MSATKKKPLPEGIPATDSETERDLLRRLNTSLSEPDYLLILWHLACFYNSINRNDLAKGIVHMTVDTNDDESKALGYLRLGQLAEQRQNYKAALAHYTKGLALRPTDNDVAYFLHNNTGYCLNVLGRHTEAERHCRLGIEIDSGRANAFKNLGISLAGQDDAVGAAWAYVEATKADARDSRAIHLLEKLIADHPEVTSHFPGILNELDACRKAVETAEEPIAKQGRIITDTCEICQLKYVPGKGFKELKEGVETDISEEEIQRLYSEEALVMLGRFPSTWCSIVAPSARQEATTEEDQRKYLRDLVNRVLEEGPRYLKRFKPSLLISPGEKKFC